MTRGSVTFTCPVALATFVAHLISSSTVIFTATQTGDAEWRVEFSGGY